MRLASMGREVVVAVTEGRYGEFDGKREKWVLVKIIGE
jgi:hypothetical protein